MKSARQLTVEALCRMEKEDAWSNLALDSVLSEAKLSVQDRGFASALFYGTLIRQYTIDGCIKPFSNTPLQKTDAVVRSILRSAFYQLLYMDSVPDHAAVSESVALCRKMKKSSASGFVNAVLRGFLRTGKAVPPPYKDTPAHKLAMEYSCPPKLINFWVDAYGEEATRTILEQSLDSPPTFLRVNPLKNSPQELLDLLKEEGVEGIALEGVPNCILLEGQGAVHKTTAYKEGRFHNQDLSSQQAALSLDPQEGDRVLDICAAPGGKSFIIAQELKGCGEVVSCDLHPHRIEQILSRNKRLGLSNITTHAMDMTLHHPELGLFDRVLCDAPCSGYGTIRRRPEIKYRSPDEFPSLPALQLQLLESASKYCKQGGILVYSTCTLSPRENEQIVGSFLEKYPEFALSTTNNSLHGNAMNTILLGENRADGFFIATMKRIS